MKERISITLDRKMLDEIDKRVDGDYIKNRSQQIELLLEKALGTRIPSKAVILAGGKGTRLRPLTDNLPKPLLKIKGKTIIEHLLDLFKKYGIRDIIISVGYLKEKIMDYFEDGSRFGVNITYIEENRPLGTAGPLKMLKEVLDDPFILTNGDELKDINIPRMFRLHKRKNAMATIALTTTSTPEEYGVVTLDGTRVLEFLEKPEKGKAPSNLINAGFYILEPGIIELIPDGFSKIETDVFPKLASRQRLRGFVFTGSWFDTGTIERFKQAEKRWKGIDLRLGDDNDDI